MQGTQVQSLIWEDCICHRATKPVGCNYWAHTLEPVLQNYQSLCALEPVLQNYQSLCALEPVLCNERNHCNKKPTYLNKEQPPLAATR